MAACIERSAQFDVVSCHPNEEGEPKINDADGVGKLLLNHTLFQTSKFIL